MNHRTKMRSQKSVAISKKMALKQEKFTYHSYCIGFVGVEMLRFQLNDRLEKLKELFD